MEYALWDNYWRTTLKSTVLANACCSTSPTPVLSETEFPSILLIHTDDLDCINRLLTNAAGRRLVVVKVSTANDYNSHCSLLTTASGAQALYFISRVPKNTKERLGELLEELCGTIEDETFFSRIKGEIQQTSSQGVPSHIDFGDRKTCNYLFNLHCDLQAAREIAYQAWRLNKVAQFQRKDSGSFQQVKTFVDKYLDKHRLGAVDTIKTLVRKLMGP